MTNLLRFSFILVYSVCVSLAKQTGSNWHITHPISNISAFQNFKSLLFLCTRKVQPCLICYQDVWFPNFKQTNVVTFHLMLNCEVYGIQVWCSNHWIRFNIIVFRWFICIGIPTVEVIFTTGIYMLTRQHLYMGPGHHPKILNTFSKFFLFKMDTSLLYINWNSRLDISFVILVKWLPVGIWSVVWL